MNIKPCDPAKSVSHSDDRPGLFTQHQNIICTHVFNNINIPLSSSSVNNSCCHWQPPKGRVKIDSENSACVKRRDEISYWKTLGSKAGRGGKDMFDVPAEILIEFGLQLSQLLLSFPHILLQLQTRLPGVVITSCQSSTVAHLVTCNVTTWRDILRRDDSTTSKMKLIKIVPMQTCLNRDHFTASG